jgi:hypothetical protein
MSDRSIEELKALSGAALRNALREPGHSRDDRLTIWSEVVRNHPGRGIGLLRSLVSDVAEHDADIWHETLYGLRELKHPLISYDCEGIGDHT